MSSFEFLPQDIGYLWKESGSANDDTNDVIN